MAQVHIAADLSAQYFSVNVKPTARLPSPRSISSLLSKHSTMTTLWLSAQCSLYRLSLLFAKSRFKFRIFLVPSYLRPLLNTFVLPGSLKEAGHITSSRASYGRSLEGTDNSGGQAGKPWRWQRRSLEKFL